MRLVRLDGERVPANQIWRDEAVDVAFGGLRPVKCLAESGQALIGLQLDPQQVRVLGRADSFEAGDFHAVSSVRCQASA